MSSSLTNRPSTSNRKRYQAESDNVNERVYFSLPFYHYTDLFWLDQSVVR